MRVASRVHAKVARTSHHCHTSGQRQPRQHAGALAERTNAACRGIFLQRRRRKLPLVLHIVTEQEHRNDKQHADEAITQRAFTPYVGTGTHEQLLETCATYQEIVASQELSEAAA